MWLHYSHVLKAPNSYLFSDTGDGIKNYYAYMYHIKHDTSYVHFSGMNHPFGDHFAYTDGNPLLANSVKLLSSFVPGIEYYGIGIYNLSMLLSLLLAALIVCLILLEFGIGGWRSALYAFAIVALQPQLLRMNGHFSLTYCWVIPMAILLLLYLRKSEKWSTLVIGIVLLFLSFFTHPYLGLASSALILVSSLCGYVISGIKKRSEPANFKTLLLGIVPIISYLIIMKLRDPYAGRSTLPWGFYEFYAELETVFIPHSGPLHAFIKKVFEILSVEFPTQTWDGLAYIGLVAIVTSIWAVASHLKGRRVNVRSEWLYISIASVLLLILSFCIPFKWGGIFSVIADHLGPLRQFRGLGRFAWPFYFVITISSLVYLTRRAESWGGFWKVLLPIIASGIMLVEANADHVRVSNAIGEVNNPFLPDAGPEGDFSQYQAIITLPYFLVGTDYFIRESHSGIEAASMLLSYHTGLPLLSSKMARSSIPQTIEQTKLYERNFEEKSIQKLLSTSKPFAVVGNLSECNENEKHLLLQSEPLQKYMDFEVLSMNPSVLFDDERQRVIADYLKLGFPLTDGLYCVDSLAYVLAHSFEQGNNEETVFTGERALSIDRTGTSTVFNSDELELTPGQEYEMSCWIHGDQNSNQGILVLSSRNLETRESSWPHITGVNRFIATRGEWHLVQLKFVHSEKSEIQFLFMGPWYANDRLTLDQLLIKPSNTNVYQVLDKKLWLNNVPVGLLE
jgi:hypothetical protein